MADTSIEEQQAIQEYGSSPRPLLWLGSGSLLFAAIEAVCLFLVTANGVSLALGVSSIVLSQGALFFHGPVIRLPILSLAGAGALLNLWLLWNQWRLRRAPAARWRVHALTSKERARWFLIGALSVLTLIVVAAELLLHYKLHGSPFS